MSFATISLQISHLSEAEGESSRETNSQVKGRGKKTTGPVGCDSGHICGHYLKRQDTKSIWKEEVEETQAGKRRWDKRRQNADGKKGNT